MSDLTSAQIREAVAQLIAPGIIGTAALAYADLLDTGKEVWWCEQTHYLETDLEGGDFDTLIANPLCWMCGYDDEGCGPRILYTP